MGTTQGAASTWLGVNILGKVTVLHDIKRLLLQKTLFSDVLYFYPHTFGKNVRE